MIFTPNQAIQSIANNQIVALPTETVYGIFGLANSSVAVNNVFEAKNRPRDNPLICHFYSAEQLLTYVQSVPEYFETLIDSFCPGPLTFLLKLKDDSPLFPATFGLQTVACRIPNHPITLDILKQVGVPLFGPSANTSTRVSGVFPAMIDQDLGHKIAGIVDGGHCKIGIESTIIDCLSRKHIRILRPGVIGETELLNALKFKFEDIKLYEKSLDSTSTSLSDNFVTPGSKYKHYSPSTPIVLQQQNQTLSSEYRIIGLVEDLQKFEENAELLSLGSQSNLVQVATDLFANLYCLDSLPQKTTFFSCQSYNYFEQSKSSVAKAVFNRLQKIIQKA